MEAAVTSIAEVLPIEILERIFSYCTHRDLVQSIQNVCSWWREVAQSNRLWKNVAYYPEKDASSEEVMEMLKISPKLRNLILKDKYDDRVLQAITDNCADLRKLQISELPDLELNFIKDLQEKCPKIEHLSIPNIVLTELEKCEIVGKFTNLKILLLTGFQVTRSSINLKPIADHCKELEHLEFQNAKFEVSELRHLLCMRRDTLHTLGVCCCNESGECVLPAVATCKLKSLSLFFYGRCQRHQEKIVQFGRLKTLKALAITGLYSEESLHLKQIFENKNMAQIVELKLLSFHYFDDAVTEIIMKHCPLLKNLILINCQKMADASSIMPNSKGLSSLSIAGNNRVTDTAGGLFHLQYVQGLNCPIIDWYSRLIQVGWENIVKLSTLRDLELEMLNLAEFPWDLIPLQMKALRYLSIYDCRNVDMSAIEELKRQFPGLKIEIRQYS